MQIADLEDYMRTVTVVHAAPIHAGGGHRDKQVVVLEGGLGVVAKLDDRRDPVYQRQIRAECAAWLLAQALDWPDLVPVTTFRVVKSIHSDDFVSASVQLAWPLFKTASELGPRLATHCPDDEIWRIAIFDALALNTDRHGLNWGFIEGLDNRPKLIDHGHAFDAAVSGSFDFLDLRRGQRIPDERLEHIKRLLGAEAQAALADLLPDATYQKVIGLARTFMGTGHLNV